MLFQATDPTAVQTVRDLGIAIGAGAAGVAGAVRLMWPLLKRGGNGNGSSNGNEDAAIGFRAHTIAAMTNILGMVTDLTHESRETRALMQPQVAALREKFIKVQTQLDTMPNREYLNGALAEQRRAMYEKIEECCDRRSKAR